MKGRKWRRREQSKEKLEDGKRLECVEGEGGRRRWKSESVGDSREDEKGCKRRKGKSEGS